jgi:hypothetical protein
LKNAANNRRGEKLAWFKVDDAFHSSKPVLRIPRRYRAQAAGLWILAGTWAAQEESDGFVPEYVLEELCGTEALARHLVTSGLWEVTHESQEGSTFSGCSGWQFRNWGKYQPTRAELEESREKERIRKANYRKSQRDTTGTPAGLPEGHHPESEHPDPTRPDPTRPLIEEAKASSRRSPELPLPADWRPTEAHEERAREKYLDVDMQAETFRNHAEANDRRARNWNAAFNNWLIKAAPGIPSRPTSASPWSKEFHRAS